MRGTRTEDITKKIEKIIYHESLGRPFCIRTDGGPQFRGLFETWCQSMGIRHDPDIDCSSHYMHQSNGLSESGVKIAKYLLLKGNRNWNKFEAAHFEQRNAPRSDGFSPVQMYYGKRGHGCLPAHPHAYDDTDQSVAVGARREKRARDAQHRDKRARSLAPLMVGDRVVMQNMKTGLWCTQGDITFARPSGDSYHVQTDTNTYVRNRVHLRPVPPPLDDHANEGGEQPETAPLATPPRPRGRPRRDDQTVRTRKPTPPASTRQLRKRRHASPPSDNEEAPVHGRPQSPVQADTPMRTTTTKRPRGRPRKTARPSEADPQTTPHSQTMPHTPAEHRQPADGRQRNPLSEARDQRAPRPRGRPRKTASPSEADPQTTPHSQTMPQAQADRSQRTADRQCTPTSDIGEQPNDEITPSPIARRKRGRPRKGTSHEAQHTPEKRPKHAQAGENGAPAPYTARKRGRPRKQAGSSSASPHSSQTAAPPSQTGEHQPTLPAKTGIKENALQQASSVPSRPRHGADSGQDYPGSTTPQSTKRSLRGRSSPS